MNTQLPGNLAEIFPLRFRLRDPLHFIRSNGDLVAERESNSRRYSLKSWQYEMLHRFDGKRTFEELARETYKREPGEFTAMGLLNFYNWLYDENLVLCECESVFELAIDDSDSDEGDHQKALTLPARLLRNPGVRRSLKIAAVLVFFLSVLRLAYVAAPIFEPPVERFTSMAGKFLNGKEESVSIANSERSVQDTSIEKVELAAKVVPEESAKQTAEMPVVTMPAAAKPAVAKPAIAEKPAEAAVKQEAVSAPSPATRPIDVLRTELEECRIRRDEFYLQDNEKGYRQEVQRMSNLVKEIGDIENSL